MSSIGTQPTAQSDAEKRVITITTEAGDPVTYTGNPAELPGARYETRLAMQRAGAFKLLVSNNASRQRNGVICVEDLDSVLIVTNLIDDPYKAGYNYETPCPNTATRVTRLNATRALTQGRRPIHRRARHNVTPRQGAQDVHAQQRRSGNGGAGIRANAT